MAEYFKELKQYLTHLWYMITLIFLLILSYGYSVVHMNVGVDALRGSMYTGSGNVMLAAGRFGMVLWDRLFPWSNSGSNPLFAFSVNFIAVCMLLLAAISFCILFDRCSNKHFSMPVKTIFSGVLISYPLMNEIWPYLGANRNIAGSFLLTAFALLLLWDVLHRKGKPWIGLCGAVALMTIVVSSYESIAVVYVFIVCAVLLLQALYGQSGEDRVQTIVRQGLVYAAVLLASILLRVIIHQAILAVGHLPYASNGGVEIRWFSDTFLQNVTFLLMSLFYNYIITGLIYFPIAEFEIAGLLFILWAIVVGRKKPSIILPVMGILFSPFLLSVLQGVATPYRTCQVFGFFVAFITALLADWLTRQKNRAVRYISIALCMFLCLNQASLISYYLSADSLRSEREVEQIQSIAKDVYQESDSTKPVVLVMLSDLPYTTGTLYPWLNNQVTLPEDSNAMNLFIRINEKIRSVFHYDRRVNNVETTRKPVMSNLFSVLYWAKNATATDLEQLFSYCGYELPFSTDEALAAKCASYAKEQVVPRYPAKGYIVELDDCTLVRVN